MTGRVKHYSARKGYGFVESSLGDVFFHHGDIQGRVRCNDIVEYELKRTQKGLVAKRMKVLM